MAYTDSATVKKILQVLPTTFPNVFNEEVVLNLFDKTFLQYNNVDTGTEVVKINRTNDPDKDTVTLNDTTPANLTPSLIVPKTVVVANDDTLTVVYVENKDYIIDYSVGTIERASVGGSISNGASVTVWALPFTQLSEGSDYNIDITEGSIVRRAGTSIPDKATVYVDYSHSQVDVSDDLIDEVILQTEARFDDILKEEFVGTSTEQGIRSAATNYCMYLIALSQAQKALRQSRTTSDDLAKIWISLSDSYFNSSNVFISKFLKFGNLNPGEANINCNSTFSDRPPGYGLSGAKKK